MPNERVAANESDAGGRDAFRRYFPGMLVSVLLYCVNIAITFDPKAVAKLQTVLPAPPFGMSSHIFVMVVLTILFLPMPVFCHYWTVLGKRAMDEGDYPSGAISLIAYLAMMEKNDPKFKKAIVVSMIGGIYISLLAISFVLNVQD